MVSLDSEYILLSNLTLLIYSGFWVYALIDMIKSDFRDKNQKLVWALLLIFIPVLGTFFYLSMSRRTKVSNRRFNPDFSKKINFRRS